MANFEVKSGLEVIKAQLKKGPFQSEGWGHVVSCVFVVFGLPPQCRIYGVLRTLWDSRGRAKQKGPAPICDLKRPAKVRGLQDSFLKHSESRMKRPDPRGGTLKQRKHNKTQNIWLALGGAFVKSKLPLPPPPPPYFSVLGLVRSGIRQLQILQILKYEVPRDCLGMDVHSPNRRLAFTSPLG